MKNEIAPNRGGGGGRTSFWSALALHKEQKRTQGVFHDANDSPPSSAEQCQHLLERVWR